MKNERWANAKGGNPNPLFAVHTMPVQRHEGDNYLALPKSGQSTEGLYDISTRPGETIVITL